MAVRNHKKTEGPKMAGRDACCNHSVLKPCDGLQNHSERDGEFSALILQRIVYARRYVACVTISRQSVQIESKSTIRESSESQPLKSASAPLFVFGLVCLFLSSITLCMALSPENYDTCSSFILILGQQIEVYHTRHIACNAM